MNQEKHDGGLSWMKKGKRSTWRSEFNEGGGKACGIFHLACDISE
jgi:hypothetical protein